LRKGYNFTGFICLFFEINFVSKNKPIKLISGRYLR